MENSNKLKVIEYYSLPLRTSQEIEIGVPIGSEILSVKGQNGRICMWVLIDPSKAVETRKFVLFETDDEFCPDNLKFLGTADLDGENWILHVFEKCNP